MCEKRTVGALTVLIKVLRDNRCNSPRDANKAVMVDADPYDIEPRQATPRCPPRPALSTAASTEPIQGPDPRLDRLHVSKVFLLLVEVWGDVVAHEREEGRYGKGLVAVADDLEVDGVPVEAQREEGRSRVDGHHEEDSDNVFLLAGHCVVRRMHHDEEET